MGIRHGQVELPRSTLFRTARFSRGGRAFDELYASILTTMLRSIQPLPFLAATDFFTVAIFTLRGLITCHVLFILDLASPKRLAGMLDFYHREAA